MESHSSQQWKIRHIHYGIKNAVGVHSATLPLYSFGEGQSRSIDESGMVVL